jgi:hypothetical protein
MKETGICSTREHAHALQEGRIEAVRKKRKVVARISPISLHSRILILPSEGEEHGNESPISRWS